MSMCVEKNLNICMLHCINSYPCVFWIDIYVPSKQSATLSALRVRCN